MTAFKITGTPIYRIEPTVEGAGRLPRMSTGTRDKRQAEQMEGMLDQLARTGYRDLVIQLRDGQVKLKEVWAAHMSPAGKREQALADLAARKDDPLLSDYVPERVKLVKDARTKTGYDQMLLLIPEGSRCSWLHDPTHVTDLYEQALSAGHKPNTVRRSLHRAVSDLLTKRLGRSKMLAVMADATIPSGADERKVNLNKDEIAAAMDAADPEFRNALGFALTSGVDQGPMRELLVRHLDEDDILHVEDTKNVFRNRRFKLDPEAALYFRKAAAGKQAGERVFPYTKKQVETRWNHVREKIKRKDVRWKDLRGIFATYYLEAGGSPRDLQLIMGHSGMSMTLRYVRRMASKSGTTVGRAMGLGRDHLKLERDHA